MSTQGRKPAARNGGRNGGRNVSRNSSRNSSKKRNRKNRLEKLRARIMDSKFMNTKVMLFLRRLIPGPSMAERLRALMAILLICFTALTLRLAWLQLIDADEWRQHATDQQLSDTTLAARRGMIFDAGNEELVKSTTAWSVTLIPSEIDEGMYNAVIEVLSKNLNLSPDYIAERIAYAKEKKFSSVKLKNKADKDQRDAINQFIKENELKCITLSTDTRRTYSHGTLASTVLGFTGTDNNGLAGIEARYDEMLTGTPGRVVYSKNAWGEYMTDEYNILVEPKEGNSVILTIDSTVQACVEKYLARAVIENDVRNRASAIMMNVRTGAVIAMATVPDYDPADYLTIHDEATREEIEKILDPDEKDKAISAARQAQWRNKCVSDTYEPGSVFKPITVSAALEEGVAKINDTFYCPGYRMIGKERVNCHKASGHGSESLMKGMMNSCNPVMMTLGERLGGSGFFKYFKAFGFTEKTGIDLPGEAALKENVTYHSEENLNKHPRDLAVSSFGQTNVVSPIQMITAISAVANGGYLMEPYVVSRVVDTTGNVVYSHDPVVKRQVISAETSRLINSMLEATVSGGTAQNGYIAGYRIGGKTGTSEKIAEQAQTGARTYIASFCAIAPSDDPEIALLVLLDDPRGSSHAGGAIAAPVARNILSEVLPHLGINTIYAEDSASKLLTITPDVRGKSVDDAKAQLKEKGLSVRVEGEGEIVTGQIPQGGQSVPKKGKVVLTTSTDGRVSTVTVPNVKNMSPGPANREITNAGLNIRYAGVGYDSKQGIVSSQSIPAGSEVERGTVVTVEFIMSGATD